MAADKAFVIDRILSCFVLLLCRKDGVPIGYKGCTFHRYETWKIGLSQEIGLKQQQLPSAAA